MNNDTKSYRETGRAVFLAAIMVLSMVAMSATFAGAAAAQSADDPVRDVPDTVAPDETFEVTTTAQINEDLESVTLNDGFDPNFAGGDSPFDGVQIDGEPVSPTIFEVDEEGATMVLDEGGDVVVEAGSTLTITYEVDAPSAEATHTIDGGLTITPDGGSQETFSYTSDVSVQEPTDGPYDVDNLEPEEATVGPEDSLTVSADVTNTGEEDGDTEVRFTLDGETVDDQTVDIGAGETESVSFDVTAPAAEDVYTHGIETDTSSVTGTLTVDEAAAIQVDETALVDFTIRNNEVPTERAVVDQAEFADDDDLTEVATSNVINHDLDLALNATDDERLVQVDLTQVLAAADPDDGVGIDVAFDPAQDVDIAELQQNADNVDVEFEDGIVNITFDPISDAEVGVTLSPEVDGTGHFVPDRATTEITASLVDGASETTRFVVQGTGSTIIDGPTATTLERGEELDSFGAVADTYQIYQGEQLTIGAADERDRIAIHNYQIEDGNVEVGSSVLQRGTTPTNVNNLDTSNLEPGEYLVRVNDGRSAEQEFVWLEVDPLDLQADWDELEVPVNEDAQVNVESEDLDGNDVTVLVFPADDFEENAGALAALDIDTVRALGLDVAEATTELDDLGDASFNFEEIGDSFSANSDDEFIAAIEHEPSEVRAISSVLTAQEPLEVDVTIERPTSEDTFYRGDIVPVELDLDNTPVATLTIGTQDERADQNFELNVTVEDTDGSGTVEFLVNTFQLGDEDAEQGIRVIDDGTELLDVDPSPDNQITGGSADDPVVIAEGFYDLVASDGPEPAAAEDSRERDITLLRLQERSTDDDITVWEGPTVDDDVGLEDFETVDELIAAVEAGDITPQETATADNDQVVFEISSTGLEGAIADTVENEPGLDLEDFLDRDDHLITEEFLAAELITLATVQDFEQVGDIVETTLEDDERNVPFDTTFGLPAVVDLFQDDQQVLAATNEAGNLDTYYVTTPVDNETVLDQNANETEFLGATAFSIPALGTDHLDRVTIQYTADISQTFTREQVLDAHPNFATIDNEPGVDGLAEFEDAVNTEADNELATNQVPTDFTSTFTLAEGITDGDAVRFPLNSFFGDGPDSTTAFPTQWQLVDDVIDLDRLQTVERDGQTVDRLIVPPRDDFQINGTTSVAAGTTMEHISRTASGEDPPFFNQGEFTVEYVEDGMNEISFVLDEPLSEHSGQEFRVDAFRSADALSVTPGGVDIIGEVREVTEVREHVFEDGEAAAGRIVNVDTVDVSAPATIAIENEDGDVLGMQNVPENESTDIDIVLDQPLQETAELTSVVMDRDGDEFDEGPVRQSATIQVGEGAFFAVDNLDPATAEAEPGDALTVTADVTNEGDNAAEQTIEFRLDGDAVAEQTIELDAGASETVSFDVEAPAEGSYAHSIASEDDEAVGSLTVEEPPEPPEPAAFEVSDLSPQSATVDPGEALTVSATVSNVGEEQGTTTVEFLLDGEVVDSQDVTVNGDSSRVVSFDVTAPDEAGDYEHAIAADDSQVTGTLTVEEEEEDDDTDDEPPEEDDSDDDGTGFGIAAALIALLAAALLAYRRRAE